MIYRHHFQINAPQSRVAAFHSRAASMAAITPPPILVQIQSAPEVLRDGDEMNFTMWLGPFPIHWLARIEAVSAAGFSDRQVRGPFAAWLHRHTFVAADEQTTEVLDEVTYRLSTHPLWMMVGLGMVLGLPLLFAYRQWKTRRILA